MHELDAAVTRTINGWAGNGGAIEHLMIWVSAFGVPLLVLAIAGQWWLPGERRHRRHVLVAAGLSFLVGLALNQLILLAVHRMRPYDGGITHLLIAPSADFSFPSDHATASFAIAASLLLHGMRRQGLAFLAAAIVIGTSRVYVGIHYAGDVLGGAVTGVIAAALVASLYTEGSLLDRLITGVL